MKRKTPIQTPGPETGHTVAGTADAELQARVTRLGLHGILAHWDEFGGQPWLPGLVAIEETERARRSFERRQAAANLGTFGQMADFDWKWPKRVNRGLIEEVLALSFMEEPANVVLVGPNGVGKTMIAKNVAQNALVRGCTVHFTTAAEMLGQLSAQDSASRLEREFRKLARYDLLVVDELGYLNFDARYSDLLFEVVNRRHLKRPIVITTNKPFADWNQVFPNSSSVVTVVDRLVHRCEVATIEADSYRLKEARERTERKSRARTSREPKQP